MENLYLVLFLLSFLLLIMGLISPKAVIKWGSKRTRGRVLLTYSITMIGFFILFGITASSNTKKIKIQSSTMSPKPKAHLAIEGRKLQEPDEKRHRKAKITKEKQSADAIVEHKRKTKKQLIIKGKKLLAAAEAAKVIRDKKIAKKLAIAKIARDKKLAIAKIAKDKRLAIEKIKTDRKEKIETQFKLSSGAHWNLERLIKKAMNDPDSYKHEKTVYWDQKDHLIILTKYRGKNGFGGYVKGWIKAKVDLDGKILEIIDYSK